MAVGGSPPLFEFRAGKEKPAALKGRGL
jgi:hypothetical protein